MPANASSLDAADGAFSHDRERYRGSRRVKTVATALLAASVIIALAAKLMERRFAGFGYVVAWAEAAAVGGLADWYAVVALFQRPLGLPLPHTAIISSNQDRIAESFGHFVEEQLLAPAPIEQKLKSVDFAALASEWLADERRSLSLSRFGLRLLPQALSAIEETGLRAFMARRMIDQIEAVDIAPIAAKLLTTLIEDDRHQRIFDEVLLGLDGLLGDEDTLSAIRDKVRGELPSLFRWFGADAYLVRRLVTLIAAFVKEARNAPEHPLRHEFDRFARDFVDKLGSSPEYAERTETLKHELLARPEIRELAEGIWESVKSFLEEDARGDHSILEAQLGRFLADLGGKLAGEPDVRADLNFGVVKVLQTFTQTQKREIGRFIADQIRSWDIAQLVDVVELNIGADLQYIRLNGTLIGGVAGLALYAGERLLLAQ